MAGKSDAEHAAVLRRWLSEHGGQHVNTVVSPMKVKAAVERAIALLEMEVHGRFLKRGESVD